MLEKGEKGRERERWLTHEACQDVWSAHTHLAVER